MDFIYRRGSTYLVCNGQPALSRLHPPHGGGASSRACATAGSGTPARRSWTTPTRSVKSAWVRGDESALDMMWYLWCGNDSPFSGRVFHTFERAMVDDEETWAEPRNAYFKYWNDEATARMILAEFGLDPDTGHIINGHTPVKARKGESPVKAGGEAVRHRRRLLQGLSEDHRHRGLHAHIQLPRHPAQEPPPLRGRRQGAQLRTRIWSPTPSRLSSSRAAATSPTPTRARACAAA